MLPLLQKKRVFIFSSLLTVGTLVVFSQIYTSLPQGAYSILCLQFAFNLPRFLEVANQWGPAGQELYLQTIWMDYLFPVFYAFLLSSATALLFLKKEKSHPLYVMTAFFPFVAALFDFLENTLHIYALHRLDSITNSTVRAASLAASLKWGLVLIVLFVLISGLIQLFTSKTKSS